MSSLPNPHPKFDNPPIVELALSVQFASLPELRAAHFGLLWDRFRTEFPKTVEQAPLERTFEEFGPGAGLGAGVRFELMDELPMPRFWFLNESETELIQVQRDRLIVNWRKGATDEQYPLFDGVRGLFDRAYVWFAEFLQAERLGHIVPDQCEVTYVDHIERDGVPERHGQFEQVFTVWTHPFLPAPESVRLRLQYIITEEGAGDSPLGRLHVEMQPAYRRSDNRPIIVVNTTARGRPVSDGLEGVHRFFDIGHEWAVRTFVALTTDEMHRAWRMHDG